MKKLFFWFAVFAMSMLVMVQPARAEVESVAPLTTAIWVPYIGGGYPTPKAACDATLAYYGANYRYNATGVFFINEEFYGCGIETLQGLQYSQWNANRSRAPICPVPPSGDAYLWNWINGMCERTIVDCPAVGTLHSDGFFNIGMLPTGRLVTYACVSSCEIELISGYVPAARQQIGGVYYYFGKAKYKHTGASCSPDTPTFLSDFVGSLPGATCAAGQQMISMGGVTKCFNSDGTEANPNSASAVAAAKTLADKQIADKIAAAASAVMAAGGSASDVAAAKVMAAGAAAGASTSNGFAPDDPMNAFCVDNSQASICKEQTAGATTVGTSALSGLYTDGALTGGKTVSSVIGSFKTRFMASGVGSSIGGFFTVNQAAGSCPIWSVNAPMIGVLSFDFYCGSTFQNLLPWIRSVLLLIFSVIAFRIAIL